jgi:hypothetical protein
VDGLQIEIEAVGWRLWLLVAAAVVIAVDGSESRKAEWNREVERDG